MLAPELEAPLLSLELLQAQQPVLEMIIEGAPLAQSLSALCRIVETRAAGTARAAIMLVDRDRRHLHTAAAPSLPQAYIRAVDGIAIAADVGTCSAAAARACVIVTRDLTKDPGWACLYHLPLGIGLRAAWSMPIMGLRGEVLGTFGTYFTEPREPSNSELHWVAALAQVARLAIERQQADDAMHVGARHDRFLAELAAVTQPLVEPAQIMAKTAELLAEHLQANRCAYAEIENECSFVITGDHSRDVSSTVGRWPIAAFGKDCLHTLQDGQPYVVNDAAHDVRIGADYLQTYASLEVQAMICVPLLKAGVLIAAVAVQQTHVRAWSEGEIKLVGLVVARCWEVLERARVMRALQASEAKNRARLDYAVRLSGVGFWYCDLPFAELLWDERVKEHFFFPAQARITIDDFFARLHPADREPTRVAMDESMARGRPYDAIYRTVDPASGASKWIRALGGATYDAAGAAIRFDGVTVDVTAQIQDRERLRRLNEELREHDRRKDEFLATLAHELRNPLAPIRTGLEILNLATTAEQSLKTRQMMQRQLQHLVRMVDDLLDVSRVTLGKIRLQYQRIDFKDILSSALEAVQPLFNDNRHQLAVDLPQQPCTVNVDVTRMVQVMVNLLTNAAKYTPPQGRIDVTVSAEAAQLAVRVADTGVGIPAEMLQKIFDPFTQVGDSLEHARGGMGLGLALVRNLVTMHGGTVDAASRGRGAGSTFTLHLPLAS